MDCVFGVGLKGNVAHFSGQFISKFVRTLLKISSIIWYVLILNLLEVETPKSFQGHLGLDSAELMLLFFNEVNINDIKKPILQPGSDIR